MTPVNQKKQISRDSDALQRYKADELLMPSLKTESLCVASVETAIQIG